MATVISLSDTSFVRFNLCSNEVLRSSVGVYFLALQHCT
jgi:hypothetical protein